MADTLRGTLGLIILALLLQTRLSAAVDAPYIPPYFNLSLRTNVGPVSISALPHAKCNSTNLEDRCGKVLAYVQGAQVSLYAALGLSPGATFGASVQPLGCSYDPATSFKCLLAVGAPGTTYGALNLSGGLYTFLLTATDSPYHATPIAQVTPAVIDFGLTAVLHRLAQERVVATHGLGTQLAALPMLFDDGFMNRVSELPLVVTAPQSVLPNVFGSLTGEVFLTTHTYSLSSCAAQFSHFDHVSNGTRLRAIAPLLAHVDGLGQAVAVLRSNTSTVSDIQLLLAVGTYYGTALVHLHVALPASGSAGHPVWHCTAVQLINAERPPSILLPFPLPSVVFDAPPHFDGSTFRAISFLAATCGFAQCADHHVFYSHLRRPTPVAKLNALRPIGLAWRQLYNYTEPAKLLIASVLAADAQLNRTEPLILNSNAPVEFVSNNLRPQMLVLDRTYDSMIMTSQWWIASDTQTLELRNRVTWGLSHSWTIFDILEQTSVESDSEEEQHIARVRSNWPAYVLTVQEKNAHIFLTINNGHGAIEATLWPALLLELNTTSLEFQLITSDNSSTITATGANGYFFASLPLTMGNRDGHRTRYRGTVENPATGAGMNVAQEAEGERYGARLAMTAPLNTTSTVLFILSGGSGRIAIIDLTRFPRGIDYQTMFSLSNAMVTDIDALFQTYFLSEFHDFDSNLRFSLVSKNTVDIITNLTHFDFFTEHRDCYLPLLTMSSDQAWMSCSSSTSNEWLAFFDGSRVSQRVNLTLGYYVQLVVAAALHEPADEVALALTYPGLAYSHALLVPTMAVPAFMSSLNLEPVVLDCTSAFSIVIEPSTLQSLVHIIVPNTQTCSGQIQAMARYGQMEGAIRVLTRGANATRLDYSGSITAGTFSWLLVPRINVAQTDVHCFFTARTTERSGITFTFTPGNTRREPAVLAGRIPPYVVLNGYFPATVLWTGRFFLALSNDLYPVWRFAGDIKWTPIMAGLVDSGHHRLSFDPDTRGQVVTSHLVVWPCTTTEDPPRTALLVLWPNGRAIQAVTSYSVPTDRLSTIALALPTSASVHYLIAGQNASDGSGVLLHLANGQSYTNMTSLPSHLGPLLPGRLELPYLVFSNISTSRDAHTVVPGSVSAAFQNTSVILHVWDVHRHQEAWSVAVPRDSWYLGSVNINGTLAPILCLPAAETSGARLQMCQPSGCYTLLSGPGRLVRATVWGDSLYAVFHDAPRGFAFQVVHYNFSKAAPSLYQFAGQIIHQNFADLLDLQATASTVYMYLTNRQSKIALFGGALLLLENSADVMVPPCPSGASKPASPLTLPTNGSLLTWRSCWHEPVVVMCYENVMGNSYGVQYAVGAACDEVEVVDDGNSNCVDAELLVPSEVDAPIWVLLRSVETTPSSLRTLWQVNVTGNRLYNATLARTRVHAAASVQEEDAFVISASAAPGSSPEIMVLNSAGSLQDVDASIIAWTAESNLGYVVGLAADVLLFIEEYIEHTLARFYSFNFADLSVGPFAGSIPLRLSTPAHGYLRLSASQYIMATFVEGNTVEVLNAQTTNSCVKALPMTPVLLKQLPEITVLYGRAGHAVRLGFVEPASTPSRSPTTTSASMTTTTRSQGCAVFPLDANKPFNGYRIFDQYLSGVVDEVNLQACPGLIYHMRLRGISAPIFVDLILPSAAPVQLDISLPSGHSVGHLRLATTFARIPIVIRGLTAVYIQMSVAQPTLFNMTLHVPDVNYDEDAISNCNECHAGPLLLPQREKVPAVAAAQAGKLSLVSSPDFLQLLSSTTRVQARLAAPFPPSPENPTTELADLPWLLPACDCTVADPAGGGLLVADGMRLDYVLSFDTLGAGILHFQDSELVVSCFKPCLSVARLALGSTTTGWSSNLLEMSTNASYVDVARWPAVPSILLVPGVSTPLTNNGMGLTYELATFATWHTLLQLDFDTAVAVGTPTVLFRVRVEFRPFVSGFSARFRHATNGTVLSTVQAQANDGGYVELSSVTSIDAQSLTWFFEVQGNGHLHVFNLTVQRMPYYGDINRCFCTSFPSCTAEERFSLNGDTLMFECAACDDGLTRSLTNPYRCEPLWTPILDASLSVAEGGDVRGLLTSNDLLLLSMANGKSDTSNDDSVGQVLVWVEDMGMWGQQTVLSSPRRNASEFGIQMLAMTHGRFVIVDHVPSAGASNTSNLTLFIHNATTMDPGLYFPFVAPPLPIPALGVTSSGILYSDVLDEQPRICSLPISNQLPAALTLGGSGGVSCFPIDSPLSISTSEHNSFLSNSSYMLVLQQDPQTSFGRVQLTLDMSAEANFSFTEHHTSSASHLVIGLYGNVAHYLNVWRRESNGSIHEHGTFMLMGSRQHMGLIMLEDAVVLASYRSPTQLTVVAMDFSDDTFSTVFRKPLLDANRVTTGSGTLAKADNAVYLLWGTQVLVLASGSNPVRLDPTYLYNQDSALLLSWTVQTYNLQILVDGLPTAPVEISSTSLTTTYSTSSSLLSTATVPLAAVGGASPPTGAIVAGVLGIVLVLFVAAVMLVRRQRGSQRQSLMHRQGGVGVDASTVPMSAEGQIELCLLQFEQQLLSGTMRHAKSNETAVQAGAHSMTMISSKWLQQTELLGKGHFGAVYKAIPTKHRDLFRDSVVAFKTFEDVQMADYKAVMMEAALMHIASQHPHVVQLIAVAQDCMPIALVLEYADLGDLRAFLRRPDARISFPMQLEWMLHIARGLAYVHQNCLVHRDLASRNVLLFSRPGAVPLAKLADFGLSRYVSKEHDYYRTAQLDALPFRWMAPEALAKGLFTNESDLWALGITFWELFNRARTPYGERTLQMILEFLQSDQRLSLSSVPPTLHNLFTQLWHLNPAKRLGLSEVVDQLAAEQRTLQGHAVNFTLNFEEAESSL
ncbi:uncharacterized protein MONBRDRAFT_27311 [Monosiga brevicollis MX1]|uniref:Protein kinase domain-containing protein n=1 Tax=Monosiga brevicollis TaxID=81824 RepID=A9V4X6_MONBE|nr:uncharacterized protein MONBRDRAFT_27311 [Monosiga brevicollis MX1]EDQ87447.1 predicted protein [Monosiga brevicollis MX1]|eukprot:XP_001747707.1 hypothetical protein [Monosiga brevicollis MX1]